MELMPPVTLTVGGSDLTVDRLEPVWIDDSSRRLVLARLHPSMAVIPIWRGEQYDAAGDWTQAQAEAAVAAMIGDRPQAFLQSLVYAE